MSAPRLVAAGYLNIDLIARVLALPGHDGRVSASAIERRPGGMAANVACAAAGLGPPWALTVELITTVGDDPDSDWALGEIARRGVAIDGVARRIGGQTPYCLILVEPGGERAIVSAPLDFDETVLTSWLSRPAPGAEPQLLYVDGYRVPGSLAAVAQARALGWRTAIDLDGLTPAWRTPDGLASLITHFDLLCLNRELAGTLWPTLVPAGRWSPAATAAVEQQVRETQRATGGRAASVVLTLGAAGAQLMAPEQPTLAVPAPTVTPVDTTGAGDVFAGALLAIWLSGQPLDQAARLAAAAAALSTTGPGALGHLPTAAAVLALAE